MRSRFLLAAVSAVVLALGAPSADAHGGGHGGGGFHGGGFMMMRPGLPFRPAPPMYYRPAPPIQYVQPRYYYPPVAPAPVYPAQPNYAAPPTYTPPPARTYAPPPETEPATPVRRAYRPHPVSSPRAADDSSATQPVSNRESGPPFVLRLLVLVAAAWLIWRAWRWYKLNGWKFPVGHGHSPQASTFFGTTSGPSPAHGWNPYHIPEP
jgi:hypothetical protein